MLSSLTKISIISKEKLIYTVRNTIKYQVKKMKKKIAFIEVSVKEVQFIKLNNNTIKYFSKFNFCNNNIAKGKKVK